MATPPPKVSRDDVQGLVFHAYKHHPRAAYLFFAVRAGKGAEARAALRGVDVSAASASGDGPRINVAFGFGGLRALGLTEDDGETFPREFRRGMTDRQRILGDDPSTWAFGRRHPTPEADDQAPLDVLVLVFEATADALERCVDGLKSKLAGAFELVCEDRAERPPDGREHFGFTDGIANPKILGLHDGKTPRSREPDVATGEFLLGYPNAYDKLPFSPSVNASLDRRRDLERDADGRADIGVNGTFLVYRKLRQDVGAFRGYLAREGGSNPEWLASRIIGRWKNGAPVALSPNDDKLKDPATNDFFYLKGEDDADRSDDGRGARCPIGAHARRANPRDALLPSGNGSLDMVKHHRVLRRGRRYGAPAPEPLPAGDAGDRGLVFIALNVNIERQFEFIQQTWLNSSKFDGLYDETDPLVGPRNDGFSPARLDGFSIQGKTARTRVSGLGDFVKLLGGGYFFLPGLRVLRFLLKA